MKTLIVHPDDRSTDFLKIIYENKGYTVITKWQPSYDEIVTLVKEHDKIMFMGHGGIHGLFGYTEHFTNPEFIRILKTKQTVYIWCNADKYVERFGLSGFYTGMFISEVGEAEWFNISTTQEEIDYSNLLFVRHFREVMDSPKLLTEIKKLYSDSTSKVIEFNNRRLYYKNKIKNEKVII